MSIDSFVGAISSYVDAFVVASFKTTNTLTDLYAIKISGIICNGLQLGLAGRCRRLRRVFPSGKKVQDPTTLIRS